MRKKMKKKIGPPQRGIMRRSWMRWTCTSPSMHECVHAMHAVPCVLCRVRRTCCAVCAMPCVLCMPSVTFAPCVHACDLVLLECEAGICHDALSGNNKYGNSQLGPSTSGQDCLSRGTSYVDESMAMRILSSTTTNSTEKPKRYSGPHTFLRPVQPTSRQDWCTTVPSADRCCRPAVWFGLDV